MNRTICKKKAKANDQKKYNIRKSYKIYQRTEYRILNDTMALNHQNPNCEKL